MEAAWADYDLIAQFGRAMEEAGVPGERNAERAAIVEPDPHLIIVKADAGCSDQSVHANHIIKVEQTSLN